MAKERYFPVELGGTDRQWQSSIWLPTLADELLKDAQSRDSSGTAFTQQVITAEGRSLILIQYDRPGLSTGQDHVVQYSLPRLVKSYVGGYSLLNSQDRFRSKDLYIVKH